MVRLKYKKTLFSFFSGAGFLDLGFERSGYEIAHVNEFYKPFMNAYKYTRKRLNMPEPCYGYHTGDVADFTAGELKLQLRGMIREQRNNASIVGFVGGPPCPDFSVGGKNEGRHGDNGKLTATYIELICQQKPDFFIFENVEGLWKTAKHREFYEEVKAKVQHAGYVTTEKLINSIEFGAPQDRNRIILLGLRRPLLKDIGKPVKRNIRTIPDFPWERYVIEPREALFALPWPDKDPFDEGVSRECPAGIRQELTVQYWFTKNDVLNHPNANDQFMPKQGLPKMLTIQEGDDSKKSFKRLHRWRYSPTVAYGNNEVHLHPYKARRISVAEALALQSLPDDFVLPEEMTLTDKFKTIGNGVPFLAGCSIAKTISYFMEGE